VKVMKENKAAGSDVSTSRKHNGNQYRCKYVGIYYLSIIYNKVSLADYCSTVFNISMFLRAQFYIELHLVYSRLAGRMFLFTIISSCSFHGDNVLFAAIRKLTTYNLYKQVNSTHLPCAVRGSSASRKHLGFKYVWYIILRTNIVANYLNLREVHSRE
jgi:hypothetical protein